jgi:hypothetical protein
VAATPPSPWSGPRSRTCHDVGMVDERPQTWGTAVGRATVYLLVGFGLLVAGAALLPGISENWVLSGWLIGWLICGVVVGCAFAFEVGKAGGSRTHAIVGGLIRGAVSGLVWPGVIALWLISRAFEDTASQSRWPRASALEPSSLSPSSRSTSSAGSASARTAAVNRVGDLLTTWSHVPLVHAIGRGPPRAVAYDARVVRSRAPLSLPRPGPSWESGARTARGPPSLRRPRPSGRAFRPSGSWRSSSSLYSGPWGTT